MSYYHLFKEGPKSTITESIGLAISKMLPGKFDCLNGTEDIL